MPAATDRRRLSHRARHHRAHQFEEQLRQAQKLESLGVLAGGLAHDFNNLLTGVMGNASLVAEDLGPDSPAAPRLKEILNASERAALLVRQMLAYAGKGRFVLQRLDLSAQVAEIVAPDPHLDIALRCNWNSASPRTCPRWKRMLRRSSS